jgi:CubicO group peptidase (beta-lactamase class C family)
MHTVPRAIAAIILATLLICCNGDAPTGSVTDYTYTVPVATGDGWEVAHAVMVGMRSTELARLIDLLATIPDHNYHSILIVRNGKLVFEFYFRGRDSNMTGYHFYLFPEREFDRDVLHCQASVSKSVTSALLGIAFDRGYLSGTGQRLFDFFPEYSHLAVAPKNSITLQHMLSMSSGMLIREEYDYNDPRNELNQFWHAIDPLYYALSKQLVGYPGEGFIYDSGTTCLLGEIVRRTTGQPLAEFARENLFEPLGISDYRLVGFPADPDMAFASSALYLRPRDMAKIGQLYLDEGEWKGQRIVSSDWVRRTTMKQVEMPAAIAAAFGTNGYGYQWWLETYARGRLPAFSARGYGSQYIVVIPGENLVVVFTGGAWNSSPIAVPLSFQRIIEDFILPAIR